MIRPSFPSPTHSNGANAYGADQPSIAGPLLAQELLLSSGGNIFIGTVTDCSTHTHSCTVTVPLLTRGAGVSCVWLGQGTRFGGCGEFSPPEVGATVLVFLFECRTQGVVLGQVPTLIEDPDIKDAVVDVIDSAAGVTAFNEDTGQVMKDLNIGGSALNAYQNQPTDAFPGDKGFINELGIGMGILRTICYLKASELCKIEGFMVDDLLRVVAKNLDVYTGAGDILVRDEAGFLTSEIYHAMSHWESLGAIRKGGVPGEYGGPIWRMRTFIGGSGDMKHQFTSIPMIGRNKDGDEVVFPQGVSERLDSSDGLVVERSIVGGGFVKSRQIPVPERLRKPEDIEGAGETAPLIDPEDLSDFNWNFAAHGDVTPQMRDAMAWVMGKQSNARLKPADHDGPNPDWALQDEADVGLGKGNDGADTDQGGHFREMLDPVMIDASDPTGSTKPRVVRINDCWIFILPDGSITIRDGVGSVVNLTRGHIDVSCSKDVNVTAGRNINFKAGQDINMNARGSIDITAGTGQARLFAKRNVFIHSEDAGIMMSTNGPGMKSDPSKVGAEFDTSGIILKPHADSDVVVQARSMFTQVNKQFFIGGNAFGTPDIMFEANQVMNKVAQAHWELNGRRYIQFSDGGASGDITIDTDGSISTESNVYAMFGTMKMNSTHDMHKSGDFCISPGRNYQILADRLGPTYQNIPASGRRSKDKRNPARRRCGQPRDDSDASNDRTFDWTTLHSAYDRVEVGQLEFSFKTARDYGTDTDDFAWTEQPWMREWSSAVPWGEDARSVGDRINLSTNRPIETWCYPGYEYWAGSRGFKAYTEANVKPNGDPRNRDDLSRDGGEFKEFSFRSMKRHP